MQQVLFHESLNDALREVVQNPRRNQEGRRADAAREERRRGRALDQRLPQPDRREKFDPEQVLWLLREGRKVGCHSGMHFPLLGVRYAAAQPIEPKDELAELQRNFIEASKHLSRMADRIERITGGTA